MALLFRQWGLLSLLFLWIMSCSSATDSSIDYLKKHTYQWTDSLGNQTSESIYEKYTKGQLYPAALNPGELEYDGWYVIDLKEFDLSSFKFLEVTQPRTKIEQLYVFDGEFNRDRLLTDINANIVRLKNTDQLIVFKISSLTRQVTFHFQSFKSLREVTSVLHSNLVFIALIIFLSSVLFLFSIVQSIWTHTPFYYFFTIIQVWFLTFLMYDTGFSRLWFDDQVHIWMGRISVLLYLISILPFIYSHFRPHNVKVIRWLFGSSVFVVVILLAMMVFIPITHSNSTIFVNCLRLFRLTSPLIILYFYKEWFKTKTDLIFILIITLIAVVPILKSIQNTNLLEGPFLEYSFSVSMIIQAVLWFIYFGVYWKETQQKKLELVNKQQEMEKGYHQQLIKGQETERQQINQHIEKELAPSLQSLQLLIEKDKHKSKLELDRIVEDLRYLSRMYISADLKKESLKTEILRFIGLIKTIKPVNVILEYDLQEDSRIDQFLLINIYRLIQQSITYSITQGNSDTIIIQILGNAERIIINIEDNSKVDNTRSLSEYEGLKNLKARLSDYQYQMQINHQVKEGSTMEIEIYNLKSA